MEDPDKQASATSQPPDPNGSRRSLEPAELAARAEHGVEDEDLLHRARTGALERQARQEAELRNRRRRRVALYLGVAVLIIGIAGGAVFTQGRLRKPQLRPVAPLKASANLISETVSLTHVTKHVEMTLPDVGSFEVDLFIFDQNRFLKKQTTLVDEDVFKTTVQSLRESLLGKWIIVFAGASMEGDPDRNLKLCRDRVSAIAGWLKDNVSPNGFFWVLPVGEFREIRDGRELDEAEEDAIARRMGEEQLRKERQLVLITIQPNARSVQPQRIVEGTVSQLRTSMLLPTNYDHGTSMPAPFGGASKP